MKEIINGYQEAREPLKRFLMARKIDVSPKGIIPEKHHKEVVSFAEAQENRIGKALVGTAPEYESPDGQISIYRDDAVSFLEKLPAESVDLIVTDPAYSGMNNRLQLGKGRIVGRYAEKGTQNGRWFGEFEDSAENYSALLCQCRRVLKRSTGHIYIMFDSFTLLSLGGMVRDFLDVKNLITWDKVGIGMGHYFRRRHEYILFATNGNNRKIRNRTIPDVWRFRRIYKAAYPTQKPVEVFQSMIFASAEKDFTVCDPFLGSASSAIAAIKNKCKFIGCDISAKSMEISRERIKQYLASGEDILQPKPARVEKKVFWE